MITRATLFDVPQGILPLGSHPLPCQRVLNFSAGGKMDDVGGTRIAKLREVLSSNDFGGVQARLAEKLGVQADYLSRVLKGQKGLSGDKAREWEKKLGKPKYFLDGTGLTLGAQPAPEDRPNNIERELKAFAELGAIYSRLTPNLRDELLKSARRAERFMTSNAAADDQSETGP
jgi:transcriptional regulator with XRE-family HTH domain